jgi:fatty-acyl-CoA synthase
LPNSPSSPSVSSILERHVAGHPERIGFVDRGAPVTYREFDRLVSQTRDWLESAGIGAGDRVALWLPNRLEWLALFFALARIGAAAVAVNTRYRVAELRYILERSRAKLLVLQPRMHTTDFGAILSEADIASLPALEAVAVLGAVDALPAALSKPVFGFALPGTPSERPAEVAEERAHDALAILFTTSGTTKGPKLVMHSQRTVSAHCADVARACGFDQPGAALLAVLPFCGVFGFSSALGALKAGAPIVLMEHFDEHAAADLIARHAITHTFGGDEMYRRLLSARDGHQPFPSARIFGFAAFEPGAAELALRAWQRGVPMTGLYGSSEVHALFALQPHTLPLEQRIEGGGRPVSTHAEIRIRDVERDTLLPAMQSGEIEIRSPSSFAGYLDNPEATASALTPDGFFRTGDVGYLRKDGTFVYQARSGDAMRLSGYLVSPAEIEDILARIPGVAHVQVVPIQVGGSERCAAFVIRATGSSLVEDDLRTEAASRMASFKVPARVWFIDAFPVTQSANGTKIQKARLREMARELLNRESHS